MIDVLDGLGSHEINLEELFNIPEGNVCPFNLNVRANQNADQELIK